MAYYETIKIIYLFIIFLKEIAEGDFMSAGYFSGANLGQFVSSYLKMLLISY